MSDDSAFTGNIPMLYQRSLVPLLFAPWADLLAERAAIHAPATILETAAGTGIVTAALARACPEARIVATDLNPAMLEVAKSEVGDAGGRISYAAADALALPYDDGAFDLVASQFGIMFYPDRRRGYAEAARVLRKGGHLLAIVWGSLDENPLSKAVEEAMIAAFPSDPPRFLGRTPFGYHDAQTIVAEAENGGFDRVSVERLTLRHPPVDIDHAAEGLCLGSPLRVEIEAHGAGAMNRALSAAREALGAFADAGHRVDAEMTALVIAAST